VEKYSIVIICWPKLIWLGNILTARYFIGFWSQNGGTTALGIVEYLDFYNDHMNIEAK
jgi:hypothetical protein